jgi:hypothetical protein
VISCSVANCNSNKEVAMIRILLLYESLWLFMSVVYLYVSDNPLQVFL